MNIQIESGQSVDRTAWDRLTNSGSFFQSYAWADICAVGLSGEAVFLCCYDREELIAGLPGVVVSKYGFRSFLSMPYDTYGGVVYDAELSDRLKAEIALELLAVLYRRKYSSVIITDRSGYLRRGLPHDNIREAFTQIIDLGADPNLDPPDKKIMGHVRAGAKLDSHIVDIKTDEQLSRFYELYCATALRHGEKRPRHAPYFFKTICEKLSSSDRMIFIALMVGDKMAGAHLTFLDNDTLINWQTVSDYNLRQYKSNHLLMHEAVTRAIGKAVRYINLGASPEAADGLIDYKKRWGGERVSYDVITLKRGLRRLVDRWRG